jgi:hypothetical protein
MNEKECEWLGRPFPGVTFHHAAYCIIRNVDIKEYSLNFPPLLIFDTIQNENRRNRHNFFPLYDFQFLILLT